VPSAPAAFSEADYLRREGPLSGSLNPDRVGRGPANCCRSSLPKTSHLSGRFGRRPAERPTRATRPLWDDEFRQHLARARGRGGGEPRGSGGAATRGEQPEYLRRARAGPPPALEGLEAEAAQLWESGERRGIRAGWRAPGGSGGDSADGLGRAHPASHGQEPTLPEAGGGCPE
jgi:hypothetical protein